ncbi:MAG: EamA family transporter [Limnohabitans sp.]
MPASALLMVLLAGLIHALWNIAAKKAGGDLRFMFITSVVLMVFWAPLGVWMGWDVVPSWGLREWALVVLSAVLHLLYFGVLLRGYRMADLTVVYPLARGSGPLISSLVALFLLDETLGPAGALGLLAIVGGVFLIAGGPKMWRQGQDPALRERLHTGLRYGLLTGVFISSYTLVDGYAVKVALMAPILVDYVGNLVRLALLAPWALRQPWGGIWASQGRYAMVVGVVSPVSYVLVLYAAQMAPLSHVAPAREVSMLFAALIGGHLLGEQDRLPRLLGAALIALGVVSLGLS